MRTLLGVVLALGLGAVVHAADVGAKKLVGKWEAAGKKGAKTTTEFKADGKVVFTSPAGGKDLTFEGTYKVAGDKVTITLNLNGKDVASDLTVKKLTADELVTEDGKGKTTTMRKVK